MKLILIGFCVLVSNLVILTKAQVIISETWGREIIEGNCSRIAENDRVFYDHVKKTGIPLFTRSETEEYTGNKTIYCITAINENSVAAGGNAYITNGGVNRTYVTIKLESDRGEGLDFYVSIYAKN